jgi:hypothetical protein
MTRNARICDISEIISADCITVSYEEKSLIIFGNLHSTFSLSFPSNEKDFLIKNCPDSIIAYNSMTLNRNLSEPHMSFFQEAQKRQKMQAQAEQGASCSA